jgi:hypothetical protein
VIALRTRYLLPLLFLVAFCVRTPSLGLPLEGEGAVIAAQAARGLALSEGHPPLMPALTSVGVGLGASPTAALRWIDAFCAALLAPLLALLALGLGLARTHAALAGFILAVHPLALAGAGGIDPGSGALATALVLAALAGLAAGRMGAARLGALAALLLIPADRVGLVLAVPLLWHYARRETSPRVQTAVLMLGAGLLVATPLTWWTVTFGAGPALADALLWLLAATLGVLLPGLPRGVRALAASGETGRIWLLVALLAACAALLGTSASALAVLPLVTLAGVEGAWAWSAAWRRRLVPGAVGGALVVSTWLVSGGLQAALPLEPSAAGRLHYLREAMQAAADTAGENGWIVLAVGEGRPAEQTSLADLQPERWTWVERAGTADSAAPRRLLVFPAAAFESGRSVAVLAAAGRGDGIHTFDGAGIYHEKVVREVGPYVVLRASRP